MNNYVGTYVCTMDVPESHRVMDDGNTLKLYTKWILNFILQGIECKALPDIVIINHAGKDNTGSMTLKQHLLMTII